MKNSGLTIYLAGPIDLAKTNTNWKQELNTKLSELGVTAVMFDPAGSFKCPNWGAPDIVRSEFIESVNEFALFRSDLFIVCLPHDVQSIGVPIEIDMAVKAGKDVILLTDIACGKSAYLDNRVGANGRILVDFNSKESISVGISQMVDMICQDEVN